MLNYSRIEIIKDFHKIATSDEEKRKYLQGLINQIRNTPMPSSAAQGLNPQGPQEVRPGPTEEEKALIAQYKELLENWESFREYVHPELEALGMRIVETIVGPVRSGINSEKEIEGVDKDNLDREQAIENWRKNSNDKIIVNKVGTYSNLKKISSNVDSEKVYLEFEKQVDASVEIFNKKFAHIYKDTTQKQFSSLYELAFAHHILTTEGMLKEAAQIDHFVKTSGLWDDIKDGARSAWNTTKEVVSSGVKVLGRGVDLVADGFRWAGGMALKGLKYLGKAFPVIGLVFSIPFFIKNLLEAIENGRRIFKELPLEKYGWSPMGCITDFGHVTRVFDNAIEENIRNPENIKEIVIIFKTIGAFWIDTLFAITNGIIALLDLIALVSAIIAAFGGPIGWLASIGALGGSFLLNGALISLELGADYFKESVWEAHLQSAKKRIVTEVNSIVEDVTQRVEYVDSSSQQTSIETPEINRDIPSASSIERVAPGQLVNLKQMGFFDLEEDDPLVLALGDHIRYSVPA